jgi:hypothetical protein
MTRSAQTVGPEMHEAPYRNFFVWFDDPRVQTDTVPAVEDRLRWRVDLKLLLASTDR